jgi:transposase-like protein
MKFEPKKHEREKMTQRKSNPAEQILQEDNKQQEFIRTMMQAGLQHALQMEFDKFVGAALYERTATRTVQRNGYYERQFNTRVGTITLHVCRDRDGKFSTTLFEQYQRSEKALVSTIVEMYFSGVSTRKVQKMTQELCGLDVSKSQVSDLVKTLDEQLHAWRNRPLTSNYTHLMFDARYEKVRENGHVVSKAFVVAIGITAEGMREVIGCFVVDSESESAWNEAICNLKDRGLRDVKFVVSDDNKGLKAALNKHFQGVLVQRCQVHFMRNFMAKLSHSNRAEGIRLLQDVFAAATKDDAISRAEKLREYLLSINKESVADWIDEHVEESLVVLALPREHRKQMKSTNMLERLNQELKRRSRCVRIFPNVDSCLRLLGAICQEISEEWSNRCYLNMDIQD